MISIPKDEHAQFLAHKWASSSSIDTFAHSDTASSVFCPPLASNFWVIDFGANKLMAGP
jgi:hypothetical protein